MEFKQLVVFQIAAKESNFTRTAEILNYAQSTVTGQIQSLESELGVALFERLGKRVILTDQGHRFKRYTDQILALSAEAKSALRDNDAPTGRLVICAQETQSTYRLPPLLKLFQLRYPKIQLVFRSGISDENIRVLLGNGELDVAFLLEPPVTSESLKVEPICMEPIVLVSHPEHPLARLGEVLPANIENQTLLLTENGCHYRRILEQTLAASGVHPASTLELGNLEAIKRCVITGVGIAVLPLVSVASEVADGKMVVLPWSGCEFPIMTQLAWHKDKWMSPALRAFMDVVREVLQVQAPQPNLQSRLSEGGLLHPDEQI